jgi:hypothetical protein|tara:strand:- start:22 stop:1092 length:1071 start_codon:yes stop_codon:yes gene_type:complete
MAYASITKPELHFNTLTYVGNAASSRAMTGVGFQPDMTWIKNRDDGSRYHVLADVVRGVNGSGGMKLLYPNDNQPQNTTDTANIKTLDSDGFTIGSDNNVNKNSAKHVAWNWKAGNAQGSSNTDGSTNTTYTSVNATAGFSISQYAGSGSLATVGHGLGAAPEMVLIKSSSHTENWTVLHTGLGAGYYGYMNSSNAFGGSGSNTSMFNNTAPTNSVFTVNTDGAVNGSGKTYMAYCFKSIKGYSKMGSYTGNQNANGNFVYLGFEPALIIFKNTGANENWAMFDNKRDTYYNPVTKFLQPNDSAADNNSLVDFLSNGFKLRQNEYRMTQSNTIIYMAFAKHPLVANVGSSIPATAR